MKLEKFKKYGIRNKKMVYSVIGIILIICGVLLLKSFAFFESKYDFNVIKGRVPEFNGGDIEIAFTIIGVKSNDVFPSKSSVYAVRSVTCQNGVTASWNNTTWSLENIEPNGNKKISCNIDFGKSLSKVVNVGDLISYTPSSKSYTIPSNLTGYSNQEINPSELDLWRVIKKNADGTIEAISEYVSNTEIYFYGITDYYNLGMGLNTIAKQYETEGITSGSRYMNNSTDAKTAMPSWIGLKAKKKGTNTYSNYWYIATNSGSYGCGSSDPNDKASYKVISAVNVDGNTVQYAQVEYSNSCSNAYITDGNKASVRIVVIFSNQALLKENNIVIGRD